MIKVKCLSKKFNNLKVLDNISFELKRGEVLAIIGPSGSGKSTLLRCLNFLERPDEGRLEMNQTVVDAQKPFKKDILKIRQSTAMVFQHYNLFKNKTALQNVTEALIIGKRMKTSEAVKIGKDLLELVGLSGKANDYPATLSGGQQQRVGIARALAVDPYVVLLDEPTSALDPELVGEVLSVIRSLARKHMTMIIVTHEIAFAREVADKVIFMVEGKIVEEGAADQLFSSPQNERTKQFLQQFLPAGN